MDFNLFTVIFASASALVTAVASSYITFKLNDNDKKYELPSNEDGLGDYSLANLIKAQQDFAYWVIRSKLVGSSEVNKHIEELQDSEPNSEGRFNAENNLKESMQKDLGVITA